MLAHTNDGFEVARRDLELRGPGELLGTRQHGVALLPGGVELGNLKLLAEAAECARALAEGGYGTEALKELRVRALELMQKAFRDSSVS